MTQDYDFLADPLKREDRWRDVLVEIYTNRIYQQVRRSIFERRENSVKVLSLVLASGAFIAFKSNAALLLCNAETMKAIGVSPGEVVFSLFMLAIVIVNSWGLVFQWGAKARDASTRFDAWGKLEEDVKRIGLVAYEMKDYKDWEVRMTSLSVGEAIPNMYLFANAEIEARRLMQQMPLDGEMRKPRWRPFVALN